MAAGVPTSNRDFVARFRDGDAAVLEQIYWTHVDQVSRVARAVLRACALQSSGRLEEVGDDLADVVQETFAKAFSPEVRRRFDEARPISPYLEQIARNVAIDHWRSRRRNVPVGAERLAERMSKDGRSSQTPDTWAEAETVRVVERYLSSLDDRARRVHDALYVRGLSQREAAVELGIGRQVVRNLDEKLRVGLRRELARMASVGSGSSGYSVSAALGSPGHQGGLSNLPLPLPRKE